MNILTPTVLRWRCRRGMLELDLFLMPFVDNAFKDLSTDLQQAFVDLLNCTDPELYAWLTERDTPPRADFNTLCELIRQHAKTHSPSL